jgi:hypothetical protein
LRRSCKRTVGYLSRRYEEDNNAAFWRGCIPLISFSSFAHEHIYIYIIAKYLFYIRLLKLYGIIIYNILSFVVLYFSAKWANHFCFCFFFWEFRNRSVQPREGIFQRSKLLLFHTHMNSGKIFYYFLCKNMYVEKQMYSFYIGPYISIIYWLYYSFLWLNVSTYSIDFFSQKQ